LRAAGILGNEKEGPATDTLGLVQVYRRSNHLHTWFYLYMYM
jgi:hypothetical protein